MLIQVNAGDVQSSDAIAQRVEEEVQEALRPYEQRVTRVEVHLRDDNSPAKAGNNDKRCTMEARLAGRQPMVVEHSGDDLYNAIHETANKLKRAVGHLIDRERDH